MDKARHPDFLHSSHTPHGHFSIHLVVTSIFYASRTVLDPRDRAQDKNSPVLLGIYFLGEAEPRN